MFRVLSFIIETRASKWRGTPQNPGTRTMWASPVMKWYKFVSKPYQLSVVTSTINIRKPGVMIAPT